MSWRRGGRTGPRLTNVNDPTMRRVAEDLIALFQQYQGHPRRELERALEEYVGVGTDYKILRGLIKLLMDRCQFDTAGSVDPIEVRQAIFRTARASHPLIDRETDRQRVLVEVANELGYPPEVLEGNLYADLPENQCLMDFEAPTPMELLDRYNLAQAQAVLYRCVEMRIWVDAQDPAGYRRLFDAIRAYRLVHTVRGTPGAGFEIRLDGPVSLFHRSQKYGVQMAVFLPALLKCRHWRMRAEIMHKRGGSACFELTSQQTRLHPPDDEEPCYQPQVGEKLMEKWNRGDRSWVMQPSRAIIDLGESVFIPDFVFHRKSPETGHQPPIASDQPVYLEILGFWTPRWLKDRLTQLERAGMRNFLLAASNELRASREPPQYIPSTVIIFQTALSVRLVEEALEWVTTENSPD